MSLRDAWGTLRLDRLSWPRALLLLPLGWWLGRLASGASRSSVLDWVDLPFHEAGHLFFSPFGSTAHYLGGTLGQLVVPAGLCCYFLLRRGEPLGAALCGFWLGQSLVNVSVYMADARTLELELVGGGDHDWNELFYRFGLLGESAVRRVSGLTHALGVAVMLCGLGWAFTLVLEPGSRSRMLSGVLQRRPWLRPLFDA